MVLGMGHEPDYIPPSVADAGNIGINVPVPQPYAFFPLGSKNESAFGLAKSRIDSLRLYLDQKTVTERW